MGVSVIFLEIGGQFWHLLTLTLKEVGVIYPKYNYERNIGHIVGSPIQIEVGTITLWKNIMKNFKILKLK